MSSLGTASIGAAGMERLFDIEIQERQDVPLEAVGEVPDFVRGTYYLAGPSRFRVGDVSYRHWLDGDGTATSLRFTDSGVFLTHKFVRSTKWSEESFEDKALYRTFGTAFAGDQLKKGIGLESPANVSAYRFGDVLLVSGEQGLPYALDPRTLETREEFTFGGRLNAVSPLSAHPCFSANGDLLNFGISFSPRQPSLTLYRFAEGDGAEGDGGSGDGGSGELVYRVRHRLPYPCSTHDFMVSDRYAVFFLSPYLLDVTSVMREGRSVMEALSWQPEKSSRLWVLDVATGALLADLAAGDKYCLHLINAFDASDERGDRLTVDFFELDRPVYDQYQPLPDLFPDAPAGRPRRLVVDVGRAELLDEASIDYALCADFPVVDPRLARAEYDTLWMLGISQTGKPGRKFFDRLERLSWGGESSFWQAPAGTFLGGEPVFLPDLSKPQAGCVLCQSFDSEKGRGRFLLFDAFRVEAGPIAELPLEHPIPLGFHASFYPE